MSEILTRKDFIRMVDDIEDDAMAKNCPGVGKAVRAHDATLRAALAASEERERVLRKAAAALIGHLDREEEYLTGDTDPKEFRACDDTDACIQREALREALAAAQPKEK